MALDRLRRTLSSIANVGRTILFVGIVSWKAAPVHIMAWGLVTAASALIPIGMVVVTKLIVDAVVSAIRSPNLSNDFRTILFFIGLELVLALLQKVLGNLDTVLTRILDDRSTLYIGTLTFDQSIRLDVSYYQQSDFFDKMRLAQVNGSGSCIQLFQFLVVLMRRLLTFGGFLALFLRLNGLLMLVLVVTTLPSLIADLRYSFNRYYAQRRLSPTARRADYVADLLVGGAYAKEVRVFDLGRYLIDLWKSIQTQLHRETIRISYRGAAMKSAASVVSLLGFYGCYGYTVWRTVVGALTLGDMTMYAQALSRAQSAIEGVSISISYIYRNYLGVSSLVSFLELEPRVVSKPDSKQLSRPIRKGIELRGVSFRYPGSEEWVLKDVNLEIGPGESIAIVGENGAGKTTLVKLLTRLYDPTEGVIRIDGMDIRDIDLTDVRSVFGVIFQDYIRYQATVQENIGFGNLKDMANIERTAEAARKTGAASIVEQLPDGYDTMLGKEFGDGIELSIGQWQKIALARAFMRDAEIFILDEPTASLDVMTEYEIFKSFRYLMDGKMCILISHRFSTVRMADRIVVLDRGTIVECGSHGELMARGGKYSYWFNIASENMNRNSPGEAQVL